MQKYIALFRTKKWCLVFSAVQHIFNGVVVDKTRRKRVCVQGRVYGGEPGRGGRPPPVGVHKNVSVGLRFE